MLTEHINPLDNFGYIIRAERERQGLSLYDLAEKAKVHARALVLFECCEKQVMEGKKLPEFTRLVNALGYTVKFELTPAANESGESIEQILGCQEADKPTTTT